MEAIIRVRGEEINCVVKPRRFKTGAEISPTVNIVVHSGDVTVQLLVTASEKKAE